ncbi:MAG: hypothetical protein ACREPX_07795 [Rhodanobacteraceae bacterium]
MRYLVCVVVGVLIGAMCALTAASVLAARHPWPRAVMTVMQHEFGAARDGVRAGRCSDADVASASAHLKLLSADIEPALLAPGAHDRVFSQYAEDLRREIAAFAAPGGDCVARAEAVTKIGHACDACHRDYK